MTTTAPAPRVARVAAGDLPELLALMRGYCDFYEVAPSDERGTALGFATIFWSFSTLSACPIGVMNDLYVDPANRLRGVGRALIEACAAECAARAVPLLEWETAPDNHRAQGRYDSFDARRETWLAYTLPAAPINRR